MVSSMYEGHAWSVSARQGNQYEIDTFDDATYTCPELVVLKLAFSRCSGKSTTRTLSSSIGISLLFASADNKAAIISTPSL